MERLFYSINNIRKKIKNKDNIKINKFDFEKLQHHSIDVYNVIKDNFFLQNKIHLFEKINQDFLELFIEKLSNFISIDNITITILESTLDVYEKYIIKLKLPITLNMIQLFPNKDCAIIILSSHLVSIIIEYLFGGNEFCLYKQDCKKQFTKIELEIIKKLTNIITFSYNNIFKKMFSLSMKYIFSENVLDIRKKNSLSENSMFLFTVFKITFNKTYYGIFRICIPIMTMNRLHINSVYLSAHKQVEGFNKNKKNFLKNSIYNCNLVLNVKLLESVICLSYIIKLKKGDILPILKPEKAVIYIDKFPVFQGSYKTVNKKNSVCIRSIMGMHKEQIVKQDDISLDKNKILTSDLNDHRPIKNNSVNQNKNIKREHKLQISKSGNESFILNNISHLLNVPVNITVQLGQITTTIKNLLEMSQGTILVLDK
ncbi:MAG TPA: FliM/FliN family flagellar motor switch protein, partial [Buchnera sp. (in: enterobacteria)]|nr:FliM/FliN family flagellar motor switch protein [Buchnera sp. (in: enterobacteria)]